MEKIQLKNLEDTARLLERHIQSAHLNFLFGSRASYPAIQLAGAVVQKIDADLTALNQPEANKKALNFFEELEYQHSFLPSGFTGGVRRQRE